MKTAHSPRQLEHAAIYRRRYGRIVSAAPCIEVTPEEAVQRSRAPTGVRFGQLRLVDGKIFYTEAAEPPPSDGPTEITAPTSDA